MGNNRAALYCRVDGGGDRETYQRALSAQRGRLEAALEYARKIKHEQKDFLTEQGIKALY